MAQCDLFTDWVRLPFLSLPSKSKSLAEGEFLFQLDPGSEFRVHRQWFDQAAMAELLETDFAVAAKDRMDRCLDRLLEHKEELFQHLRERWQDLFATHCDVLFYDLTSTYFQGEAEAIEKAKRGYSRDHRPDCLQVIIALVITPEGFPLAYEVLDGNTSDAPRCAVFCSTSRKPMARRAACG